MNSYQLEKAALEAACLASVLKLGQANRAQCERFYEAVKRSGEPIGTFEISYEELVFLVSLIENRELTASLRQAEVLVLRVRSEQNLLIAYRLVDELRSLEREGITPQSAQDHAGRAAPN